MLHGVGVPVFDGLPPVEAVDGLEVVDQGGLVVVCETGET